LVVEDNPTTRLAFAESLENLNYHVLEAENGQAALELVERYKSQVALVVSDLVMPGMGGMALAQALHRHEPSLPIIVLTGHPMGDSAEELEESGVYECLLKPVGLDQLANAVNRALTGCQEKG
jgi:CheY-like chemotaxis protein